MDIVYEDNHLIIVNKSAGELSQSDYTKDLSLVDKVKNYIKTKYKKPWRCISWFGPTRFGSNLLFVGWI